MQADIRVDEITIKSKGDTCELRGYFEVVILEKGKCITRASFGETYSPIEIEPTPASMAMAVELVERVRQAILTAVGAPTP